MELTKFGHACLRIEGTGGRVVVDPGVYSEPAVLDGVAHVLITHEHADHINKEVLTKEMDNNPQLEVWTNESVAKLLDGRDNVHTVGHGDSFDVAGLKVRVYGEVHALIHPDIPRVRNIGFMFNEKLFVPGDALTVPDRNVDTLMIPIHAPWSRISDVIDWVREVKPRRSHAVHDGFLSENGWNLIGSVIGNLSPANYTHIPPGESAHVH